MPIARRNEDDGCQIVEAAVQGRALSTRSCMGQTYVGAVSPRQADQLHDDAAGETHPTSSTLMVSILRPPPTSLLDPYRGSAFEPLYTTTVCVCGGEAEHGRASGVARAEDGGLDIALRLPPALGGEGAGTNPEQLFAAAYGACFHGALNLLAKRQAIVVRNSSVHVTVAFGRDPMDGRHGLSVAVVVRMPGVDRPLALRLVRETERLCPYAKMARQGADSSVRVET